MKKDEFKKQQDALTRSYDSSEESDRAYKSDSSVRCHASMFTTDSTDCFTCTYCVGCERCSHCTHCLRCTNVANSSYCIDSENLTGCSYVSRSRDCHDCVFCIGCVGLVGKEFHILNQPYSRDEYFKLLAVLEKSLGSKLK